MHILAVDDDPASRYLLESVLRAADYRVSAAADGLEALEIARADVPALVISDILMPRMDGYQLCRVWKADERLGGVPFAFYTASYTDAADESFGLGLGADAFWRKPLEPRVLLGEVARLTGEGGGRAVVRQPELTDEAVVLQQYSARLVDKLEEKARSLEVTNARLEEALERLAAEVAVKESLIEELHADMLRRELTEAELRRERDFSRGVLELADLFICILDADRRVTLLSAGAERICGVPASAIIGMEATEAIVAPESRRAFAAALDTIPARDVCRCEFESIPGSTGTHTIECVVTANLDPEGRPASYNVFGVDVTERRRVEQLKSEFIQTVSHELRTPLTSIIGFVDVLDRLPEERLVAEASRIVERLRENAGRMRGLVEELLEVNDIAAEGIALSLRPADLGPVVERSAESVYRGASHPLTVSIQADAPRVVCDPERMARVVTNLVDNAVKYSPAGGAIAVDYRVADGSASIVVRDQGIGIGPDEVDGLFDRFSQVDMSSTREFGGLGLGLFIVAEIVRAHGGTVRVASSPGEGSEFTVSMPVDGPADGRGGVGA